MNIYSIIPARGGSKSIPQKNIKLLDGRPLIQYSIDYSKKCNIVDRTIVSTESEKIASIARKCGAEIPFIRPKSLALDETQDFPVVFHALKTLEKLYNNIIDIIILLRPTSPLRPSGLIDEGIRLLNKFPEASSVRSVALTKEHPYRQWVEDGDYITGYEKSTSEPFNIPRQKLPTIFLQTGDIEIIRRKTLLEGSVSGDRVLPLIIKHSSMLDIDDYSDLEMANNKVKKI